MVNWKPVAAQFGQHFLHNLGNQIATRYGANPQELYERRGVPQQAPDYMQLLGGAYSKYSPYVRNSVSSVMNQFTQRRNNNSSMMPTQQGIEPMEMQKEEGYYNRPGNGYSSAAMPMVPATMMPVPPNSPRASYSRSTKLPQAAPVEESEPNYFQNRYGLDKGLFLGGNTLSKGRNVDYNPQGILPPPMAPSPSYEGYRKLYQSKPIIDSYEFQNKTFDNPLPKVSQSSNVLYNPSRSSGNLNVPAVKGQLVTKQRNIMPVARQKNAADTSFLERLWRQFINNQGS